jgi:hypothetical protein
MSNRITHAKLVELTAAWRQSLGDRVFIEPQGCAEIPDVFTVKRTGYILTTTVYEIKVSTSDLHADAKKWHRQIDCGMGNERFIVRPHSDMTQAVIPDGFGEIVYTRNSEFVVIPGEVIPRARANREWEMMLLLRAYDDATFSDRRTNNERRRSSRDGIPVALRREIEAGLADHNLQEFREQHAIRLCEEFGITRQKFRTLTRLIFKQQEQEQSSNV